MYHRNDDLYTRARIVQYEYVNTETVRYGTFVCNITDDVLN